MWKAQRADRKKIIKEAPAPEQSGPLEARKSEATPASEEGSFCKPGC